jgi:hypothetical protein
MSVVRRQLGPPAIGVCHDWGPSRSLTHRTGWYQDSGRFVPVGLWSSTSASAEVPGADEERKADAGSAHWQTHFPTESPSTPSSIAAPPPPAGSTSAESTCAKPVTIKHAHPNNFGSSSIEESERGYHQTA